MSVVAIKFPIVVKFVYFSYVSVLLLSAQIGIAVMLLPLVILSAYALFAKPKALAVIGTDKESCLKVITVAADHLEVEEIHIYEAKSTSDVESVGVYDSRENAFYEFEDEEE